MCVNALVYAGFSAPILLYHPNSTYITSTDGVHGEQVVSVAQLELDHLFSCSEVSELLLLRVTALLNQILQEKSVFTHPLDRLQQVGRQVHLIAQLHLFILKTTWRHSEKCVPAHVNGGDMSSLTLKKLFPWLISKASERGLFLLYRAYIPNCSSYPWTKTKKNTFISFTPDLSKLPFLRSHQFLRIYS